MLVCMGWSSVANKLLLQNFKTHFTELGYTWLYKNKNMLLEPNIKCMAPLLGTNVKYFEHLHGTNFKHPHVSLSVKLQLSLKFVLQSVDWAVTFLLVVHLWPLLATLHQPVGHTAIDQCYYMHEFYGQNRHAKRQPHGMAMQFPGRRDRHQNEQISDWKNSDLFHLYKTSNNLVPLSIKTTAGLHNLYKPNPDWWWR